MSDTRVAWSKVRAFAERAAGVILDDEQVYLLEARLGPVAKDRRFASIEAYVAAACSEHGQSELSLSLLDAITTHETFFFRDAAFWKYLEQSVLPAFSGLTSRPLRIWSSGCSHGQEPYSLAILLDEHFPQLAPTAEIYATDISAPALTRARSGLYTSLEVNRGLGAARLSRHFEQDVGGFRIRSRLRERVRWDVHNLLGPQPSAAPFDIVMCRNVLIYFSTASRRQVLATLMGAARQPGYLALGVTEACPATALSPGWFALTSPSAPRHS